MELNYDWRSFQAIFYPQKRSLVKHDGEPSGPGFVITDQDRVVAVFAENEDLSDWVGASIEEISSELSHRDLILFSRQQVDAWMQESIGLPHFHDQLEFLKEKAKNEMIRKTQSEHSPKKGRDQMLLEPLFFQPHFLLSAIRGWWNRVLPSSFGIFLRLEGQPSEDLLVVIRRGRIESFTRPDLSFLGVERINDCASVVKYLMEKQGLPIQGVFVSPRDWMDWTQAPNPWLKVAQAIRSDRLKLVPFRWGIVSLVSTRGFLGF